jgi:hypothetical protein
MIEGTIYQLTNIKSNCYYIGSSQAPYKRYYEHCTNPQTKNIHPDLFEGGVPSFKVLHQGEYETKQDLRIDEQKYIKNSSFILVNHLRAYCSPEELREQQKKAKNKYNKTWKGKESKKWTNYRGRMRKKLLTELNQKVPLVY